jgi:zinc transporter 2
MFKSSSTQSTSTFSEAQQKLLFATALCTFFMLIEIVGGLWSHSIAILTDAAHLLSDIIGFVVSLVALSLAKRKATAVLSFGFKRAEVVGALFSVAIIWIVTGYLLIESFTRSQEILAADSKNYHPIDGRIMFSTACFGLVANLCILRVLGAEHGHSHGGSSGSSGHGHSHHDVATSLIRRLSTGNSNSSIQQQQQRQSSHGGHSHSITTTSNSAGQSSHSHSHDHPESSTSSSTNNNNNNSTNEQQHHDSDHSDIEDDIMNNNEQEEHIVINGLEITYRQSVKSTYGTHQSSPSDMNNNNNNKKNTSSYGSIVTSPPAPPIKPLISTTSTQSSFHEQPKNNINVNAAYAHAVGDLLQSLGVMLAGGVIWWFPNNRYVQLADPIATLLFSILVLFSTNDVLRTSLNLLMEGVPNGIDPIAIKEELESIDQVVAVHDLHVWALSEDVPCLSVHLVVNSGQHRVALINAQILLKDKFKIKHSTIQTEDSITCSLAGGDTITNSASFSGDGGGGHDWS